MACDKLSLPFTMDPLTAVPILKAPKYASCNVERFFAGTPDVEDVVLQLSVEMINNKEMKMKKLFLEL